MHRLAWLLGIIGLPLSHYWLLAKVEPFYSLIYCFLWWPYILVADLLVYLLRKKSILSDRPWEFLVLCVWSVPLWLLFEMVNLRIQNWYYVMAPYTLWAGLIYLVFAFGAVLPGVFETADLIVALVEKFSPSGKITSRPFVAHRGNLTIQITIGALMLAFVIAFPKSCFALAWGFAFFGIDPICYWLFKKEPSHIGRSLLGQMASGDNTRFVALLLSGFICGGLWESWNLHARTKWIYTVPFFDEIKLGEMPILGFLGFPPFVLECYALVNLLTYYRCGRSWELTGAQNQKLPGLTRRRLAICAIGMPLAVAFSALAMLPTVASFTEPLHWHFGGELGRTGIEALRNQHALQANEFLKLTERPPEIDPNLWQRLRAISQLAELKGIGLEKALLLEQLQITRPQDLSQQDPDQLAQKLRFLGAQVRPEESKVWIRAALRNSQ